jgi:SulP family sulfate permease
LAHPDSPLDRHFPLLTLIRDQDRNKLRHDLIAGLTVALFTIPQAMAYALVAGFPPSAGIMTAVVASILGAAFGSSEFLVNGPTNAIAVMLAAQIALNPELGDPVSRIVALTLLIGLLQLLGGWLRLGSFTRFVSEPVLTGFTAGAGIYIAVNQLPSVLGIARSDLAADLWGWVPPHNALFDLARTLSSLGETNLLALGLGAATLVLVRGLQWLEPRLGHRLPAPFLTVVLLTLLAYLLGLGEGGDGALRLVRDIEPVARGLPTLAMPALDPGQLGGLLGPALTIGLLGAVEAIAIGKLLAARAGHPFDASRQLVGEGMCNLGAALVGGFASSGSFTRTAVNFEAGAITRLSVIYSGVLVLAIVWLLAPAANLIPIAVLGGTLVHIGLKLVNLGRMRLLMQTTHADRTVLLVTFSGVLLATHLEYALGLGVAVSVFQALRRAEGFKLELLKEGPGGHLIELPLGSSHCPRVAAIDLQGELFFAGAEVLERRLKSIFDQGTRALVLRLAHAYNLDATCVEALAQVSRHARAQGSHLILAGVKPGMYDTLERAGLVAEMGADRIFRHEPLLLSATLKALAQAHALAGKGRDGAGA